jgi:hypothetical protein
MAKILRIDKRTPRRKKFEHFKLKFRVYLFRVSYLTNFVALLYLLEQQGSLTNIINKVTLIIENLKYILPH